MEIPASRRAGAGAAGRWDDKYCGGMTCEESGITKINTVITRLVRVIYTSLIMDCPDEPGNDDIV